MKKSNNSNNINQNNHFPPFAWVCAECKIVNHFVSKASISVFSFFFSCLKIVFRRIKLVSIYKPLNGLSGFHAESTNLSVRVDWTRNWHKHHRTRATRFYSFSSLTDIVWTLRKITFAHSWKNLAEMLWNPVALDWDQLY